MRTINELSAGWQKRLKETWLLFRLQHADLDAVYLKSVSGYVGMSKRVSEPLI